MYWRAPDGAESGPGRRRPRRGRISRRDAVWGTGLRTHAAVAGLLSTTALLGACATPAPPPPAPAPITAPTPVTAPTPAGGALLSELGFTHHPAGLISVPRGARLGERVDQPNVLLVTLIQPSGPELQQWFTDQLPRTGFQITGDGPGGLTFSGHGVTGAFTSGGGLAALSVRRDPG